MLKINKGEPWIMWPDHLVGNFIDFPANKIFAYEVDYSIRLDFELTEQIEQKSTLLATLPQYCGIDLERYGLTLILTYEDGVNDHGFYDFYWQTNVIYKMEIVKTNNEYTLYIDDLMIANIVLNKKIASSDVSHIIFGSGNFPVNGFNLNYLTYNLYYFEIKKDGETISKHKFNVFINEKSFDLTDNCNFIYKI